MCQATALPLCMLWYKWESGGRHYCPQRTRRNKSQKLTIRAPMPCLPPIQSSVPGVHSAGSSKPHKYHRAPSTQDYPTQLQLQIQLAFLSVFSFDLQQREESRKDCACEQRYTVIYSFCYCCVFFFLTFSQFCNLNLCFASIILPFYLKVCTL